MQANDYSSYEYYIYLFGHSHAMMGKIYLSRTPKFEGEKKTKIQASRNPRAALILK